MTQKSGSPLNPKDQLLYVPCTKINQINGLSIIVATDTIKKKTDQGVIYKWLYDLNSGL